MFSLFYIHLFHPILPIKPKYDVTNELVGWDKVGEELLRLNDEAASANEKTFLMAGHWLLCSQMLWATKDKIPLGCFNHRMDQFDFWEKENTFYGMNAFVVTSQKFPEIPEQRYKFDRSEEIKEIDIKRGGVIVRRFKIFKVYNFKGLKP